MPYKLGKPDYDYLSDLFGDWRREEKALKYRLGMDYLSLSNLYGWFIETAEKYGVPSTTSSPPYYPEIWDLVDNTTGAGVNKDKLLAEIKKHVPGVVPEIDEKQIDAEATRQLEMMAREFGMKLVGEDAIVVDEETANKVREFQDVVSNLQSERKRRRLTEKELENAVKMVKSLRTQLQTKESEAKAGVPIGKPMMLRILKPFQEGITSYRTGQVVETYEWDWAWKKVREGLAVPVIEPSVEIGLNDQDINTFRLEFVSLLRVRGLDPERFVERFNNQMKLAQQEYVKRGLTNEEAVETFRAFSVKFLDAIFKEETEKLRVKPGVRTTGLYHRSTVVGRRLTTSEVASGEPMKRYGYQEVKFLDPETMKPSVESEKVPVVELRKLSWGRSDFEYKLGPYAWACSEAIYDNRTLVRCVAEDTMGFFERYFFLKGRMSF